jgi:hypothetical protein
LGGGVDSTYTYHNPIAFYAFQHLIIDEISYKVVIVVIVVIVFCSSSIPYKVDMGLKWLIFLIRPLDLIGMWFSEDQRANIIKTHV